MRGSGDAPAATASRSEPTPAQKTAKRARVSPCGVRESHPPRPGLDPLDAQPVTTGAPAAVELARKRPRHLGEVDDPGRRRVQRRDAPACGSISRSSSRRQPPQPRHAVLAPAPLELVERRQLAGVARDDHLAAALVADPLLARRTRTARARPPRTGAPSASRARSRCRRGSRRCWRPSARRATAGPASSTTASSAGRRRVSSRATARPRMPPPTTTRSHSLRRDRHLSPPASGARRWPAARGRRRPSAGSAPRSSSSAPSRARRSALRGVADQVVDLGRAQEARVDRARTSSGSRPDVRRRRPRRSSRTRVRLAGRDHVVVGLVLLEHQPHRLDVVLGVAPVALGVEVAERAARRCRPSLIAAACHGDLAGDELEPAARRLVVEEDPASRRSRS